MRDACREVRSSDLPRDWPLPYGLGESTRAYLVGGSRFDGRGVSFRGEPIYKIFYKFFGAALAEARFNAGRVTDALALVDHAVNAGEGPAWGLFVPEIHRLRGVFLRSLGSPVEEVERALHTALQIADEQGALLLKVRTAMSLARLWRDQGKPQQARELLAPAYGWFTEGFDTLDLKEAKALLEEMAA
jgi:predicted ATPase